MHHKVVSSLEYIYELIGYCSILFDSHVCKKKMENIKRRSTEGNIEENSPKFTTHFC